MMEKYKKYFLLLKQKYLVLEEKVNQFAPWKRVILICALLIAIYLFWFLLITSSQYEEIKIIKDSETTLTGQSVQIQDRIAKIKENAKQLDVNSGLVSQAALIPILKAMMMEQEGVELKTVINLSDIPLDLVKDEKELKLPFKLYEQPLTFVFEGTYMGTYEYLKSMESLPQMIFWEELQYDVQEYPKAEIKLTFYTVVKTKEE
jgi:MSHA biogenesis protein MshJ